MAAIHGGLALALRLEGTEAANSEAVVTRIAEQRPGGGAMSLAVCGGIATFCGPGSPLSQMLHIGLAGPVTASDWNSMERFFRERESPAVISLCPFADPSVFEWLSKRHYRISHFEHTLVRELPAESAERSPETTAPPDDMLDWARKVIEGFADGGADPPGEQLVELVVALGSAKVSTPFQVRVSGEIASVAILGIVGRTAILHCDSTLAPYRGQGFQSKLIRDRLRRAAAAGCDLAMACTVPGTASQRNYERAGFQVAYTKTMLVKDWN